jgi:hypothetical protein
VVTNRNTLRALGSLPVGTRVKLYAKYRDGSPRPRFRWGKGGYLQQGELTVVEHRGDCTLVSAGKATVPVWSGMRIS